jgi:membrane protein implicated in regulation of membrane protease activity
MTSAMSPFVRYLLLQIPGWLAVTAALAALHWLTAWPLWIVPVGLAVFVAKDVAMYRIYRDTLRPPTGLVGARGRAVERLAPHGYVRIEGELWRAQTDGPPLDAGTEIIVRKTQGLTLHVTATPR